MGVETTVEVANGTSGETAYAIGSEIYTAVLASGGSPHKGQ